MKKLLFILLLASFTFSLTVSVSSCTRARGHCKKDAKKIKKLRKNNKNFKV